MNCLRGAIEATKQSYLHWYSKKEALFVITIVDKKKFEDPSRQNYRGNIVYEMQNTRKKIRKGSVLH